MTKKAGSKASEKPETPKARAKARMAAFSAGVKVLARGDEKTQALIEKLASKDKGLKSVNEALSNAAAEYADLRQLILAGKLARSEAAPRIAKIFSPLQKGRLVDIRQSFEAQLPARPRGFETQSLGVLFDTEQLADSKGWQIDGDWSGPSYFKPLRKDIGQRRDPLPGDEPDNPPPPGPQPFTDCAPPPYARERKSFSGTGPGLWMGDTFTTPARGSATSMGTSTVLLVGGAATYGEALVGRDLQWPAGFGTMRVEAEIDVSAHFFAIAIGVSGAGGGGDLVLEVTLNNGTTARATVPLGAVVAPVFWWAEKKLSGNYTLSLDLALPPGVGSARLMAGVVSHSAAGGIAGAGAIGDVFGTVSRLCASFS